MKPGEEKGKKQRIGFRTLQWLSMWRSLEIGISEEGMEVYLAYTAVNLRPLQYPS